MSTSDTELAIPSGHNPPLRYLPYQEEGIRLAMDRRRILIADEMGLGKAQPMDSCVLTPDGWKRMGDMRIGDLIISPRGGTSEVTGVFPQGAKEVFRVTFSDGSSTECCDDHLWAVNDTNRRFRGLPEIAKPLSEIRTRLKMPNGNRCHYIPMTAPVEFRQSSELPIHPYLLGCLLGNGGLGHKYVGFSTAEQEQIDLLSPLLPEGMVFKFRGEYDWAIVQKVNMGRNIMRMALDAIGMRVGSLNKFIPSNYLFTSSENRMEMLRGLLDTDGYICGDGGAIEYCSISKALADGVVFIVRSMGGTARVKTKIPTFQNGGIGQLAYRVSISMPRGINPFKLSRKAALVTERAKYIPSRAIESVESIGFKECQCISVSCPSRLYVTDDFIVTHNTVQAVGVLNQHPKYRRVLVLCPASLCQNWEAEIRKWSCVERSIGIARSGAWPDTDIVILAYTSAWRDAYPWHLRSTGWDMIILDEAHRLKNHKSKQGKAIYGESKIGPVWGKQVMCLTGTPIPNRPAEAWAMLAFLWPDLFANWFSFMKRYCAGTKLAGRWDTKGNSNEAELAALLRKCGMIRRLKRDVLEDLPPKTRQVIPLDPTEEIRRIMDRELMQFKTHEDTIKSLEARRELAAVSDNDAGFREAGKALRAALGETFGNLSKIRTELGMAKIPWVVEQAKSMLDEAGGKLVVMCYHHAVIDGIALALDKEGIECVTYDGRTPVMARHGIVRKFQEGSARVFIGNMQAAGVGITLTAADKMIFAELDWVPSTLSQAEDRIHRIGQKANILIVHMVFNGSLDAQMLLTVIKKQEIIDTIIDAKTEGEAPESIPEMKYEKKEATIWNVAGNRMTVNQRLAAGEGIKFIARLDTDKASARNGEGFSKMDSEIGLKLNSEILRRGQLSPAQCALAAKILRKYHRQLPAEINNELKGFEI